MSKEKEKNMKASNKMIDMIIAESGNQHASRIADSEVLNNMDSFSTSVYALNIAIGGALDGCMTSGANQLVGESKTFKTMFLLILAKGYLDKYPDAVFVLFDSEFGTGEAAVYIKSVGLDETRITHLPIDNIENLKIQLNKLLNKIERGQKVFFGTDSIGLLPSINEVNNALESNYAKDMTRAAAMNSLFRTITPQFNMKNIPAVFINHSYKEQTGTKYAKNIVKGGTDSYKASDTILMITRSAEKDGEDLAGYSFNIVIEKSRNVKEKSKLSVVVTFDGGIDRYSGMLELGVDSGFVEKVGKGIYQLKGNTETFKEDGSKPYLQKLVQNKDFAQYVKDTYRLVTKDKILEDDNVLEEKE